MTHIVRTGETLGTIAAQYGTTVLDIMRANGIRNPNLIYEGQALRIPRPAWANQQAAPPVPTNPSWPGAAAHPGMPAMHPGMPMMGTGMSPSHPGMATELPTTGYGIDASMTPHQHHPLAARLDQHEQRLDALEARVAHVESRIRQLGR